MNEQNRYEQLADKIMDQIRKDGQAKRVSISIQDAVEMYYALLGMSRIMWIVESEHGGSEFNT